MFAVLVRLPKSSLGTGSKGRTSQEGDGVILLFNVTDPVPVATWSVRKVWKSSSLFSGGGKKNDYCDLFFSSLVPLFIYIFCNAFFCTSWLFYA